MKNTVFILLIAFSGICHATEETERKYNPALGTSPFTGFLGLEVQQGSWAVGFGFPAALSVKHYQYPDQDSIFIAAFWNRFSNNDFDDYEDGVYFKEYERRVYGVGAGYRWLWDRGWNISTGLALGEQEEVYDGPVARMDKDATALILDLTVGYQF